MALLATAGCETLTVDPDPFTPFQAQNVILTRLPEEEAAVKFIVLGDWGRRGSTLQRSVAERMGDVADRVDADFVVTTGNNFYDDGVRSVTDSHWQASFERVYTHEALQVPWYPSLGNHDYRGNVDAQVEYSAQSDRWEMPARYYATVHEIDDTTSVQVLIIDTIPLDRLRYREVAGEADAHERAARRQLRWLDSTLTASTARWNVIVGHHPVYSAGDHGDSESLIRELQPILERHGVEAYFAGHDHNLQHLRVNDVDYFVSGTGSDLRRTFAHPAKVFGTARPGFLVAAVAPRQMLVQFVDAEGNILYGDVIEEGSEAGVAERP